MSFLRSFHDLSKPPLRNRSILARMARRALLALGIVTLIATTIGFAGPVMGQASTSRDGGSSIAVAPTDTTSADDTGSVESEATPTASAVAQLHTTYVDDTREGRTVAVTVYFPEGSGPFPLVVLAHGFAVSAETYAALAGEIASGGFVVAVPDFPRSSSAVTSAPVRDYVEQASDVSFVVTSLLDTSTRPAALGGIIAATPVGVIGHSDGGITAAGVAFNSEYADARIGAAVVLSGGAFGFPGTWFDADPAPALLAVHGDADEVNPFSASTSLYDAASGPKWLVSVTDGTHLEPFTTGAPRTSIAVLVVDFLRATLQGDAAAEARITSDASVSGTLELIAQQVS